jgi:hypothetical protein
MAIHAADVLTEQNKRVGRGGAPHIDRENEPRPDSALTLASMASPRATKRSVGRFRLALLDVTETLGSACAMVGAELKGSGPRFLRTWLETRAT